MTVTTSVDFINAVQALLPASSAWVQGYDSKDAGGKSVGFEMPTAVKFSLYGALKKVYANHRGDTAYARHAFVIVIKQLNREIKKINSKASIKNYNDRPTTTFQNISTILTNAKTSLGG